ALWRAIERRTSPTRDARPPRSQRWLGLSWLGAAVAALGVLAIASLDLLPGEPRIDYVAVMAPEASSDAAVVVSARTEAQELTIELLRDPGLDADSDLELWAVSRSDGEARSLGLLSADARQSIAMTTAQTRLVREAETLLLTVEPAGGSPLGEPGGSVYASGLCVQLYADPSPPERG
ncbi:MAG: anti-sigma factor, partial [Pseudomonadota bacterium]